MKRGGKKQDKQRGWRGKSKTERMTKARNWLKVPYGENPFLLCFVCLKNL